MGSDMSSNKTKPPKSNETGIDGNVSSTCNHIVAFGKKYLLTLAVANSYGVSNDVWSRVVNNGYDVVVPLQSLLDDFEFQAVKGYYGVHEAIEDTVFVPRDSISIEFSSHARCVS